MNKLNWNLVFSLSIFGLAMGIATVYFIPSKIEPILWLLIFIICAYLIAKRTSGKYFLHGLLVSIFNSVWITAAHFILYNDYASMHAEEMKSYSQIPFDISARNMMLIMGPLIGIISGLILGLFAFIAGKMVKKTS